VSFSLEMRMALESPSAGLHSGTDFPSAAKAGTYLDRLAARLKPCPFKPPFLMVHFIHAIALLMAGGRMP
jgi:hypothetical protein